MKDMTTLLGKYFTNSKTGAVCVITAVDEENRRVTADIGSEVKEMALGTITGGWRKATDEEIASASFAIVEIPATDNGCTGPSYEAEPIPAKPESQSTPAEPQDVPNEPEAVEADTSEPEAKESSTEPMKLSEVVGKLEGLFDTLNDLYYEGKLPKPVITIQSTPKFYGHCSTKQIWKAEDEAMYEINIGAEFLNRPKEATAATLQHEMVHLYCRVNDIDETCQKGRYHNKTFKLEAEARGLIIGYNRTIGYSPTEPSEEFKQKLQEAGFDLSVPFCRETIVAKRTGEREKAHKYVCPICGQEVKTTAELSLICGTCEVPMGRED